MPSVKRRMVDNWPALLTSIGVSQRLAVACRGHLSALLVVKLIRFGSDGAIKRALKHAAAVMSRRAGIVFKVCSKQNCWESTLLALFLCRKIFKRVQYLARKH